MVQELHVEVEVVEHHKLDKMQMAHIQTETVEQEEVEVHTQSVVVHLYSMAEEEVEVTTLNLT